MENNLDDILIKKCIDISCVEKKDQNNNTLSFGWTISLASFKDDFSFNKKVYRDYLRTLLSTATELEIDKQGRVLIPVQFFLFLDRLICRLISGFPM